MFIRVTAILVILTSSFYAQAQNLPIDFEENISVENFIDFDGGSASIIDNPHNDTNNNSTKVAQIVRDGGTIWAGSKIALSESLDFTTLNKINMKVYTTAPIGTIVKFKLEGNGTTERDVQTTVNNAWETLTWDFTGEPSNFNEIVFMFDFGNVGDGSQNSTFLFDDIEQVYGGKQIDWPVDFEADDINYTMTDFGGNISNLVTDPSDPSNHAVQVIKTDEAATWAGTTIGTNAGFASDIPLSLTSSIMTVKVWSPEANTPIRLKVEDDKDPTHTCETETNTTLSGAWETLVFDFSNEAPGTQSLEVGLSFGWTFNMASIFFNFGTEGQDAGEQTYYFDDVYFGEMVSTNQNIEINILEAFPNPTNDYWRIASTKEILDLCFLDARGHILWTKKYPSVKQIQLESHNLPAGIYFARCRTNVGYHTISLLKQ